MEVIRHGRHGVVAPTHAATEPEFVTEDAPIPLRRTAVRTAAGIQSRQKIASECLVQVDS